MNALDLAVQQLVDHDREDAARTRLRYQIIHRIVDEMKHLGHYPCIDCDPICFRCGNIVVSVSSDTCVKYEIIEMLRQRMDE
jgi:hypothetical protein